MMTKEIKTATSVEQSRRLIELGIDRATADMHYARCSKDWRGQETDCEFGHVVFGNPDTHYADYPSANFQQWEKIPAWSLTALLALIPAECNLHSFNTENGKVYRMETLYMLNHTKSYDNPVDAAFELVCWMYENERMDEI